MKITRLLALSAVLAAPPLSGCATMSSKSVGSWGREFSGVRCVGTEDYWAGMTETLRGTQALYTGVDYIFSAAFDLAFLPIDLIVDGVTRASGPAGRPAPLCNDFSRRD